MSSTFSKQELIQLKAFQWIQAELLDNAFVKFGWKPVFKALDTEHHCFWSYLFRRLDVPDNLHGLKAVLFAVDWMAKDLAKKLSPTNNRLEKIQTDISIIKQHLENTEGRILNNYESEDFYGILTKHPMYSLLISAKGNQTHFSQFALYPVSWLLVFLADPIKDSSRLYNINKEFRRLASQYSLSVKGTDDFSGESTIYDALNEILNTSKESPSEYNLFFVTRGLKSALNIIRQVSEDSYGRAGKGFGGKVFGATVIGRNNQVSAIQGSYKNIPTENYSEDLGEFRLKGFVNNSLFQHKEPSLKVIDPADHTLTTTIEVPISSISRTRTKRKSKTARPESELDSTKRKINSKFLGDSTIRANQHFITNTSTLDDYALEVLIIELQNWYQTPFELRETKQGIHPTIAVAVLASCLLYGNPLEQTISTTRKSVNSNVDGYFISEKNQQVHGQWLLESPLSNLVKNNTIFKDTKEVKNFYRLPIPLWLTQILLETEVVKQHYIDLELIEKDRQKTIKHLGFVWTITDFQNAYESFFVKLRKRYAGIEINLRLVEQYLLNASLHDYDVIFSAYFTNKRTLFSHTQLFYTRIKEQIIYSKFAEFWDHRLNALALSNSAFHGLNIWPRLEDERYIGSALIPQKNSIKKIIHALQNTMKTQSTSGLEDIFNYHQTYTIYTMVFLSYATGYRGVHQLLPSWRLISEDYKWLAISDKDDLDSSHTRLTFLTPLIRQQLQHYHNHLNALLSKILQVDFYFYQQLINIFRDWQFKLDYRTSTERLVMDETLQGAFFTIDAEKKAIHSISLNYFFDHLKKEQRIELPANGGRHLLRTEALSAGIPSDLLDAFLGHFIYGKEPHSVYSALDISEIEQGMEHFLEQHLKSLGFSVIKSKLTR